MHTCIELLIDSQNSKITFGPKQFPATVESLNGAATIVERTLIKFVLMYEMFWKIVNSAVNPSCFYIGKPLLSSGVIASNSRLFQMESHD